MMRVYFVALLQGFMSLKLMDLKPSTRNHTLRVWGGLEDFRA